MRVLVIEPAGNKWGSERALLDLLDYLHGVDLAICIPPRRPLKSELARRGIRMFPSYIYALHEKTKLHRAWAALNVLATCLIFRPQVIYLNQSGAYKIALVASILLQIPMVAHIRIFEDVAYIAKQRPNPRTLHAIIAISGAISEEIGQFRALDAIPSHRILDSYALHAKLAAAKTRTRIEGRFACVGRVAPVKGQDVLIAALPLLSTRGHPIECVIAGNEDGDFAVGLKEVSARDSGPATVRWAGVIDDSVGLLRSCVAMVVPSHREALGRVLFEAWEAGTVPIVYAGSGGAAEIVNLSGGGVLYDEQTGASLAAALESVLSMTPDERAQVVGRGRSWMLETCDPAEYARAISAIFSNAASTRRNH